MLQDPRSFAPLQPAATPPPPPDSLDQLAAATRTTPRRSSISAPSNVPTYIVVVGIAMIVAIGVFALVKNARESSPASSMPTPPRKFDKIDAIVIAKEAVLKRLKAPATADFPATDYDVKHYEDGSWEVVSYVDAQNSFGAKLRNNWIVKLQEIGGGKAQIVDVRLLPR